MSWTIHYQPIQNPRADDVLLTFGRATYAAGKFEDKCKYVLRIFNLVSAVYPDDTADPVMGLEEAIARLPPEGTLNNSIQRLMKQMPAKQPEGGFLHAARKARNFIAHEGSSFGIHSPGGTQLVEYLDKLHEAVRDLAAGDNLISLWEFEIEEPDWPTPSALIAGYEDALVRWVLGPVWDLLSNPSVDPSVPDDGRFHERVEHYRAEDPGGE